MQLCNWRMLAAVLIGGASIAQAGVIKSGPFGPVATLDLKEGQNGDATFDNLVVVDGIPPQLTFDSLDSIEWTFVVDNSDEGTPPVTQYTFVFFPVENKTGLIWTGFDARVNAPVGTATFDLQKTSTLGGFPYFASFSPDVHTQQRLAWLNHPIRITPHGSALFSFLLDVPNINVPGEDGYEFTLSFAPLVAEPAAAMVLLPAAIALARRPRRRMCH